MVTEEEKSKSFYGIKHDVFLNFFLILYNMINVYAYIFDHWNHNLQTCSVDRIVVLKLIQFLFNLNSCWILHRKYVYRLHHFRRWLCMVRRRCKIFFIQSSIGRVMGYRTTRTQRQIDVCSLSFSSHRAWLWIVKCTVCLFFLLLHNGHSYTLCWKYTLIF